MLVLSKSCESPRHRPDTQLVLLVQFSFTRGRTTASEEEREAAFITILELSDNSNCAATGMGPFVRE